MKRLATILLSTALLGSLFQARAALTMRMSADGGLNWTNVADNGPLDFNGADGVITYAGPVGNWTVIISQGDGKPAIGSAIAPNMDAGTTDISSGPATLIVQLSDTDFTSFPNETYIAGTTTTAAGTLSYNVYRDSGNVLFGSTANYGNPGVSPSPTAARLFNEGPFASGTSVASNGVTVPSGGSGPYSLTLETVVTHFAAGTTLSDTILFANPPPAQPCLTFEKTADTNSALAGSTVGYTYAITNCGGTPYSNLAIIDDAGTPGFPGDDFTVASGINLAPGQGASYHLFVNLPVVTCVSNSNPATNAGLLLVTQLPNGNIKVTYRQSRGLNDNVYGTPAPADGWSQHKFSDLTGSDQCEFQFTDSTGKVVLDFFSDYISQTTSNATYPSGYASLGPNGGDGKMVTGAASNVLFYTSTLADNLNSGLNGGFPSPYTVNSPTPESSFPNWDYVDGYTVIVSSNAFGAAGFGGVTVPTQHNSPAKVGANQVHPVPCGGCITNIASVVTVDANGNILSTVTTDDAVVCTGTPTPPPPTCIITAGPMKIGPNNITISLKNAGTANIVLSEADLTWNQGVNGKITKMSLNGDFFTPTPGNGATSPATITGTFVADPNKRTIAKGQTKTLMITFEHPASKAVGDYTGGAIKFGACTVNFP
jgi:hypothetical protein